MKLSILLAGSILTSAIAGNAYAQTCGAQPSCSSLGYNLSSTSGCLGTAVKCPFENKYNCITQSNLSEYSKNSSNWWYKDKGTGLIFQGGKIYVSTTTESGTYVSFPKSFSSKPMTLVVSNALAISFCVIEGCIRTRFRISISFSLSTFSSSTWSNLSKSLVS